MGIAAASNYLAAMKIVPLASKPKPDYGRIFTQAIDRLHAEGRYRMFIDILRNKGMYPNARCFAGHNGPKPITVWCPNDRGDAGQGVRRGGRLYRGRSGGRRRDPQLRARLHLHGTYLAEEEE